MRIGASLLLIAAGAILRFAITPHYSHGVNWATIGVVLMIVGAVGGLIELAFMTTRRRTDVTYRTEPAVPQAGFRPATSRRTRRSRATHRRPTSSRRRWSRAHRRVTQPAGAVPTHGG